MYLRWGIPMKHRLRELSVRGLNAFGRRMDWWLDQMLIKLDLENRYEDTNTEFGAAFFILDDDGSFEWRDNNNEENN